MPTSRENSERKWIKVEIGGHLANRCDVYATPSPRGPPDSSSRPRVGSGYLRSKPVFRMHIRASRMKRRARFTARWIPVPVFGIGRANIGRDKGKELP
jgi:hypothetical protein